MRKALREEEEDMSSRIGSVPKRELAQGKMYLQMMLSMMA
jgi:hypothetical protein